MAYGLNLNELFRQAATYVDRIFKGEKPGDLPIRAPTKFELIINVTWPRRWGSTCRRCCSRVPTR
ncbi:MAG: hypothetical protein K2Y27_18080 [Xanthobacteraceae bacterium]|nr:hypothetical protein [Xanthobacteraceae bacterium]